VVGLGGDDGPGYDQCVIGSFDAEGLDHRRQYQGRFGNRELRADGEVGPGETLALPPRAIRLPASEAPRRSDYRGCPKACAVITSAANGDYGKKEAARYYASNLE